MLTPDEVQFLSDFSRHLRSDASARYIAANRTENSDNKKLWDKWSDADEADAAMIEGILKRAEGATVINGKVERGYVVDEDVVLLDFLFDGCERYNGKNVQVVITLAKESESK